MPRKPPKVEVPKTAYRRRPKHPRATWVEPGVEPGADP
jgi:hypothetical protein